MIAGLAARRWKRVVREENVCEALKVDVVTRLHNNYVSR